MASIQGESTQLAEIQQSDDVSATPTGDECTDKEPDTRRVRELTFKGNGIYMEYVGKYKTAMKGINVKLSELILESATCENELSVLNKLMNSIEQEFYEYESTFGKFHDYLFRQNTRDSLAELEFQKHDFETMSVKVRGVLCKIKNTVDLLQSDKSSKGSMSSKVSVQSIQKAETAKVKYKIAEEKALLRKQKAQLELDEKIRAANTHKLKSDLDTEMDLLNVKEEFQVAEAEYNVVQSVVKTDDFADVDMNVPPLGSYEKSRDYVQGLKYSSNHAADAEPFQPARNTSIRSQVDVSPTACTNLPTSTSVPTYLPPTSSVFMASQGISVPISHTLFQNVQSRPQTSTVQKTSQIPLQNMVADSFHNSTLQSAPQLVPQNLVPQYTFVHTQQSVPQHVVQNPPVSASAIQPTPLVRPSAFGQPYELSNFLLKKDLILQRMQAFSDDSSDYLVWKGTFKNIVGEAQVNAYEELQLLLRWLGPESTKQASSIRRANPNDPITALTKIWYRLDERYGAPELVDTTLRNKIKNFPRLTLPKDKQRMYELSDILAEVESIKGNPQYSGLFAYYDTSGGVNPIVSKLPYYLQNKWIDRATRYKKDHAVTFPPFSYFVAFVSEISSTMNDPSFTFEVQGSGTKDVRKSQVFNGSVVSRKTQVESGPKSGASVKETQTSCPLHPGCNSHTLDECRLFKKKTMEQRRQYLSQNKLCFRCCRSSDHVRKKCAANIKCSECGSSSHVSVLHVPQRKHSDDDRENNNAVSPDQTHGGESDSQVNSKCTAICGECFKGRSCSKTLLVRVYPQGHTEKAITVYAMLDEHCNRTLASSQLLDGLGVSGEEIQYTLSSCSGSFKATGRRAHGYCVESLDGSEKLTLPTMIECSDIPTDTSEIPTPEIAHFYPHLEAIADFIPVYDPAHHIGLLIGRDLLAAHHIQEQILGPEDSPFAQRVSLGWVIIGEVCLDKKHTPVSVKSLKTHVFRDGRTSIFQPCSSDLTLSEVLTTIPSSSGKSYLSDNIFARTEDDNKTGLSVEDRQFLHIMDAECTKSETGNLIAPLPFRSPRERFPNNRHLAVKRAKILDNSLKRDPLKCRHFVDFMQKVLDSGAAEIAPDPPNDKEVWYLPIFGVYHPKKRDRIRGVFDSSAVYQGVALNKALMTGPNLTNCLLGILMRFRKDAYAISGDIEQMFYSFFVKLEHRDYLRFLWYKDNDPKKDLVDYRMCAHVFGNSPSPAVATYGLRKCVENSELDVKEFVNKNFYVDDALTSLPSKEEAISLMKRTKSILRTEGNLNLHKIVSNNPDVMLAFSKDDLGKNLKSLNLDLDALPVHQSLGLSWDLSTDSFIFNIQFGDQPNTRRGFLSLLHSVFDPLGFVAPLLLHGKIILREIASFADWDETLDSSYIQRWEKWKSAILSLETLEIPRMYMPTSLSLMNDIRLHVFCDASQEAISAVAYLQASHHNVISAAFIMGKLKLAPTHGHTIPRLELCAALLATEVGQIVKDNIHVEVHDIKFYSDSKVVLGYVNNKVRRFYNYVSNRVERILQVSNPNQWTYISSENNPADHGTRGLQSVELLQEKWLKAPAFLSCVQNDQEHEEYPLVSPDNDKEIRTVVSANKTLVDDGLSDKFEKFSSWTRLVTAFTFLKGVARRRKSKIDIDQPALRQESEQLLIRLAQKHAFYEEISCLERGRSIDGCSPLNSLSPYLDEKGLLRVGGRLNQSILPIEQRNPVILSRHTYITKLIVWHYHQITEHQGRQITEGSVRNHGFWIIGAKRLISSLIHHCVTCRKIRRKPEEQRMADLPVDRVTPGPPFSSVGVDAFGPWAVVARKTRGGLAQAKRWAIMFSCLTTKAIHIEVVESMSSSSFINAVRRLVAIRGNVKEFRSDRGTNFIGATEDLKVDIQSGPVKDYLQKSGITWIFNVPHSSHMGGVWERMIGITRNVLNSMLLGPRGRNLTHEVLVTLMAEVSAIVNSRPIAPVSYDADMPLVLSPAMLLNQRTSGDSMDCANVDIKDIYKEHWKQVQVLSDIFWKLWRERYLQALQERRKWTKEQPNLKKGDIILLKDKDVPRTQWPLAVIENVLPSSDGLVRKVEVRLIVGGKPTKYFRPVSELVRLFD